MQDVKTVVTDIAEVLSKRAGQLFTLLLKLDLDNLCKQI